MKLRYHIEQSQAAPWFHQPGGGTQYRIIGPDGKDATSSDYSVHLRNDGTWWIIDTVNDRGQRHNDTAKLSTFDLTEKYLIWTWGSSARGAVGAERLGPRLYSLGFSPEIEVLPIKEGIAEVRSRVGSAVLMEPNATIFSHLMTKSVEEIEQMVREGIT